MPGFGVGAVGRRLRILNTAKPCDERMQSFGLLDVHLCLVEFVPPIMSESSLGTSGIDDFDPRQSENSNSGDRFNEKYSRE